MRRILAVMAALLVFSAFAVAQPAETPDGEEDGDAGPPGFVSDLVFNKVPGFLSGLFASLPVPDFVKGFFGAEDNSTNDQ